MEEINVLEILDCYYPKFDGPTLVITSYSKSFLNQNKGINPTVIVPKFPKYVDNQPFEIFRTASIKGPEGYYAGAPQFDAKLKKFLKNKKIDLIHFHSPFTLGKYFVNYGKKHNIPTVFSFHTKFKDDFQRVLKSKSLQNFMMDYIMKTINKADYVWTVSNGAADVLREYGCKKDILVIRNGTDLTYLENAEEKIKLINEQYKLTDDDNIFLSVGRIVENKRLGFALDALKIVKDKGYNFKYLIVGDGPYLKHLKDKVDQLNLTDNVIFTGKIMDRDLLSAHYLRSDLFIFPSTFDTASLAPIEAAAMKLPSIMTRGCSTAEIITEDVNGYLADDNIEDWANKISSILDNKENLKEIKEKAYEQVYKTWDQVADEVQQKYREIIKDFNQKISEKINKKTKKKVKKSNQK